MIGAVLSTILVVALALIGAVTVCNKLLEIGDKSAQKIDARSEK